VSKKIDLDAVRQARRNLAQIAAEHPELRGPATVEGWVGTLKEIEENEMAKTIQVGVRLPAELIAQIDKFAADETLKLAETLPGMELSRADAIRILTTAALQARGYEVAKSAEKDSASPPKARRATKSK
jgi:anti-sigma factor RsiW